MTTLGTPTSLPIIEITDKGAVLDCSPDTVFVANKFLPKQAKISDEIQVTLYKDAQGELQASTATPLIQAGQFASLRVKQVNKLGAFVDWGLPKDLLVPNSLQHKPMIAGKHYLLYAFVDEHTDRLVASTKIDKFLDVWPADYNEGQEVSLIIGGKTDLGYKAIINHQHWGLLYHNEVFRSIRIGQKIKGFIKQVREDGRIDLSLSQTGRAKVKDFNSQLLEYLENNNGFCPLHDKSEPALIAKTFNVSKKTFKSSVGNLLKQQKITISSSGIYLTKS